MFRLGHSAGFLGPLLLRPGRQRLLLEPAFLLCLLAALLLQHRELLPFFGTLRRQRRLLLLERLEALGLRFALSCEFGQTLRLLAFPLALGRGVLPLAFALHPFELEQPALFLGAAPMGGFRFPFEIFDSLAFLLASLLVLRPQALQLFGNLLFVDDDGFDRLDPGTGSDGCRDVSQSEDEHRCDHGMEHQRVEDGQQANIQRLAAHCRISCGASVINPTLGAPARCRIVISVTTSP